MRLVMASLICGLLSGCSLVRLTTPDGFSASYTRIGSQKIGQFKAEPTEGGGFAFTLENQESDGSAQALEVLSQALIKATATGAAQ